MNAFYTIISKNTVDEVFTLLFRNLGLLDEQTDLIITQLEFDGDVVIVNADVNTETLQ